MNGCDRADQMISYYSTHNRKTRKWWKKLFLWILEVTQVTAHILYVLSRPDQPKKIPFSTFKDSLVAQLEKKAAGITPVAIATAASHRTKHANVANAVERFQGNKHLVDSDGADVRCVLCAKEGKKGKNKLLLHWMLRKAPSVYQEVLLQVSHTVDCLGERGGGGIFF